MSDTSHIGWTDATWNPVTGCDRVSEGCDHCYALKLAARLKAMGNPRYQHDGGPKTSGPGFGVTLHPDVLNLPRKWRKPRRVFVNSMSDLFHSDVPSSFVAAVWDTMRATPQHQFQILTKRPRRMRDLMRTAVPGGPDPLPNVWLGTSVENQHWADQRIPLLLEAPAAVRFLSCEPLLGPIDLTPYLEGLGWVIVGGESGPNYRPMNPDWLHQIVDDCQYEGVPVFVKQNSGPRPGMSVPDGPWPQEFPAWPTAS